MKMRDISFTILIFGVLIALSYAEVRFYINVSKIVCRVSLKS